MKHLVVPTDFSDYAHNALNFAINIANHYEECFIHLIHVYQVSGGTGMMESVTDFMETQANETLSQIVKESKQELFHGTNLVAKAIEGETISVIVAYTERLNADYIIMGTQGASGLKEIFLGSNTVGVIKDSHTPVLAIPSDYVYRPFNKIVLAIDDNIISTGDIVEPMVQLAEKYHSTVKVLHVGKAEALATIDAGVDIYLADIKHSFHFVKDKKINDGIDRFVREEHADLLCMIRRERDFIYQLFHASLTRKEAFDSEVPLLILHDK